MEAGHLRETHKLRNNKKHFKQSPIRLQKADAPSFSSKQSSHQMNEIIKSYLQLGSSSNRYAPRLPQQETKSSTKQLPPTGPILGPENILKTGFAQKGLPSRQRAADRSPRYGAAIVAAIVTWWTSSLVTRRKAQGVGHKKYTRLFKDRA